MNITVQEERLEDIERESSEKYETSLIYSDIIEKLRSLKYRIIKSFGIESDNKVLCTHILVATPQNHEALIFTPRVSCEGVIILKSVKNTIIPEELRHYFSENTFPTQICFVSHFGIDTFNHESGNFTYQSQDKTVLSLNKGQKFYLPMPYIDFKALTHDEDRNRLDFFIEEGANITLFREAVISSDNMGIFAGEGPITVYIPSDAIMKKTRISDQSSFVLSHVFNGEKNSDAFPNVKPLHTYKKRNGTAYIINATLPVNENATFEQPETTVTYYVSSCDIANSSYMLWKVFNEYERVALNSIKSQLAIMTKKIEEAEKDDNKFKALGVSILKENSKYRDIMHSSPNDAQKQLESMNKRIAVMVKEYQEHITFDSKIIAIDILLQMITKMIRDM